EGPGVAVRREGFGDLAAAVRRPRDGGPAVAERAAGPGDCGGREGDDHARDRVVAGVPHRDHQRAAEGGIDGGTLGRAGGGGDAGGGAGRVSQVEGGRSVATRRSSDLEGPGVAVRREGFGDLAAAVGGAGDGGPAVAERAAGPRGRRRREG